MVRLRRSVFERFDPTTAGEDESREVRRRAAAPTANDGQARFPQSTVRHDRAMADPIAAQLRSAVPRIPASAGALIFDARGRLLVLNPSYKQHWTIPGGQIEPDGESPWETCRRETREECGLEVERGTLVCIDFLRPKRERPGGVRFLFNCGTFSDEQLAAITLQDDEILDHRLVELSQAKALLSRPIRRRVIAATKAAGCVYLEDGRPVPGVQK
jgi:8-oxo-dGTP pyrophosphatase MutT (NUDIX family)